MLKELLNEMEDSAFLGECQMDMVDLEMQSALERFGANVSNDHVDYLYDSEVAEMVKAQKQ